MAKTNEPVITKIRAQAQQGSLAGDVVMVFRLSGGSGDQALDESIIVTAGGSLQIRVSDQLARKPQGEARKEIGRPEALELCRLLLQGLDSMVPAAQARFVPDTVVASVTLGQGGDSATFYFAADEEDREHRGEPVKPEIKRILERVRQIEAAHLSGTSGKRGQDSKKEAK